MRNAILVDWIPNDNWRFKKLLNEYTSYEWEVLSLKANGQQSGIFQKLFHVYFKYFTFPFKIFLKRKKYDNLLAWQQFFGLIFAFYCRVFNVKNYPKVYIMTFIYKPKKGLLGLIYFKFIKTILQSKYIEKIICFSKSEIDYYSKIFKVDTKKFDYCIYSLETQNDNLLKTHNICNLDTDSYFLSVGRSNRDYDFLVNSLKDTNYNTVILCDKLNSGKVGNIHILNNVFDEEYLTYLKNCIAVIIPLKDENISSGQLVFLKAMEYGKPIIITKSNTIDKYIINDYNGVIISKDKESLIKAMEKILNDKKYYDSISTNAFNYYKDNLSFEGFVKSISNIVLDK